MFVYEALKDCQSQDVSVRGFVVVKDILLLDSCQDFEEMEKQAGAELCQAQES